MKKKTLSSFLQRRFHVFMYRKLGWKKALSYLVILGHIYFFVNRSEKRKIQKAIEEIFCEGKSRKEIKSLFRKVLQGILHHYYEKLFNAYAHMAALKTFLSNSVDTTDSVKIDRALQKGRGVMFITGHYGGIEYTPILLGIHHYPVSVVASFATSQLKDSTYMKTKPLGIRLIDVNMERSVIHCIIRELKANRIVFIECDEIAQWKPSQTENMWFLRKRIGVDKSINLIHKRTGAEIVFGILHRFSLQKYRLILEDYEGIISKLDGKSATVGEAVLKYLEEYIYYCPEEWYQWKNYSEIRTDLPDAIEVEGPKSPSLLPQLSEAVRINPAVAGQ